MGLEDVLAVFGFIAYLAVIAGLAFVEEVSPNHWQLIYVGDAGKGGVNG